MSAVHDEETHVLTSPDPWYRYAEPPTVRGRHTRLNGHASGSCTTGQTDCGYRASMNPALVVIDMQKRFIPPGTALHPELGSAVNIINEVAGKFRAAGRAVIWVQDCETMLQTDPGFQLLDELDVRNEDPRVAKVASNAFAEPGLAVALDAASADFALLCGYRAEECVLATAHGAADRELRYALLRGAVLSLSPEAVEFAERVSPLLSYEVAVALLSLP
jgi:nicotinamidase-related amidase